MTRLLPDYREVIMLRHVEGQSVGAVAEPMGRTPGAVRVRWLRALERLGGLMEGG